MRDHRNTNTEDQSAARATAPDGEGPEDARSGAPQSHSTPRETTEPSPGTAAEKAAQGGAERSPKVAAGAGGSAPVKTRSKKDRRRLGDKEILARLLEKDQVILDLTRKNEELTAQLKSLEDKRLRMAAEFDNYRKRTQKEWELLRQQTKAEVVLEILEVVDNFERAFAVVGEAEDDFVRGIRLIYNNLTSILGRLGVTRMDALNRPFDPRYHTAVAQIDSETVESGHVVETVETGYLLDDSVLRPAKVVIAK